MSARLRPAPGMNGGVNRLGVRKITKGRMVGLEGFEPPTHGLGIRTVGFYRS